MVVVYIGAESLDKKKAAMPRVRHASDERSRLTPSARAIIDARLAEGLRDIKEGRGIGPFSTAEEAMKALLE